MQKHQFVQNRLKKVVGNYGWVRDNDIISAGYWKTFTANFADAVKKNYKFNKTPKGEFMIEAYNYYDPMSVADVVVFAKGTIESPVVTKIIQIYEYDGEKLDKYRRNIYALERRGIQPKAGELFEIHRNTDFGSYVEFKKISGENARNNEQSGTDGRTSSTTTEGNIGKASIEFSSPEEAKESGEISDAKFSIEFVDDIANKQRKYAEDGLSRISSEELEKAIADTAHMVKEMKPYANILPQDKVGKTLVKNGSYDVSVENTTVRIRTIKQFENVNNM